MSAKVFCAQTLKHAISHFRESRVKQILEDNIYERVKKVADALYPHVEVLDGGSSYKSKGPGFAKLVNPISTKKESEVEEACKFVYDWLKKPNDAFRAYLQIMSGAGIVYAAQVEEKVIRAAVLTADYSKTALCNAAKLRLCTDAGAAMDSSTQDDWALTQQ